MPWVRRARRPQPAEPGQDAAEGEAEGGAGGAVPGPNEMRRERRALARQREVEMRDVGGLTVEMVRRDRFRPELLFERANDVLRIEQRLHELDAMLLATVAAARGPLRTIPHCHCGAPLPPGFHFCANCGRPAPGAPPVAVCGHCGQPLPAEANFCASCGNSVAADEFADEVVDETMVHPWPADEERAGEG
jgi:hypothetical protein